MTIYETSKNQQSSVGLIGLHMIKRTDKVSFRTEDETMNMCDVVIYTPIKHNNHHNIFLDILGPIQFARFNSVHFSLSINTILDKVIPKFCFNILSFGP